MRLKLLRAPAGLESLHQIRRTDHGAALRAHHLHRAGVHQRHVWDGVPRRILHGDSARAADQARQVLVQFVETGINQFLSRQTIERARLDAVHQLPRNAAAGNQIKPAARAHAGAVQSQYTGGNRIAMMKIVEEPAVQACGPQFLLDGFDWRHYYHPTTRPGPTLARDKSPTRLILSRFRERCDGADLLCSGPLNFHALQAAPLAPRDFNSGQRDIQMSGQKAPQGFVGAALHGRNLQANAQSALPFAVDLIAAGPRLNTNEETQSALALPDFDHFVCRAPKSAVPRRICVAPSSMAISKSRDIPMDNSGMSQSSCRERRSRISCSRRKNGRTSCGSDVSSGTVIRPRNSKRGIRSTPSARRESSAGSQPDFVTAESSRTSISTGKRRPSPAALLSFSAKGRLSSESMV